MSRVVILMNGRGSKRTKILTDDRDLREEYVIRGETWKVVRVDPVAVDHAHVSLDDLKERLSAAAGA